MMKTLDDYLNDPELADEPSALREVHAIRLMIHDETKDMTAAERTSYFHKRAARFFASDADTQERAVVQTITSVQRTT